MFLVHENEKCEMTLTVDGMSAIKIVPKLSPDCDVRATNFLGRKFDPPEVYKETKPLFMKSLFKTLKGQRSRMRDGHSGQISEQTLFFVKLVNTSRFIKTVCETGFNAGHSSLSWLSGNPNTKVYSFDLGSFYYSRQMASFLQKQFPKRLTVIWGDSKVTIPTFVKENPRLKCDLIYIDGGHGYPEAKADLKNFQVMAKSASLLLLDDVLVVKHPGVSKALAEEVEEKHVEVNLHCQYSIKRVVLGRYII